MDQLAETEATGDVDAQERTPPPIPSSIWLFSAVLALVIGTITIARHHFFLTGTYDMGFYVHDVWQIAHGNWTNSVFGFHVFADHFSPILILLAPVAYLSTAEGLLAVQGIAVASTVIPAFRLGAMHGGRHLGWLAAIWVGLSANVWHTFIYDFRPATLGFVALVWLIAELEGSRRLWLVVVLCLLAASAREDVAVLTGVAVLIQSRIDRSWRLASFGFATAGVGLWYTMVGQRWFAPFEYFLWYRYADYGDTPIEVLQNLDYAIPTALGRLMRGDILVAVAALLLPSLLIPAFRQLRRTWPAFLIILSNAVSIDPAVPTIYFQYYLMCVAFIAWGSVHAFEQEAWRQRLPMAAMVAVAVFVGFGPMWSFASTPYSQSVTDVIEGRSRTVLAAELPQFTPDGSVSAGSVILPHVAERPEVYSYPLPMVCSDVILRYTARTAYPDWVAVELNEYELHGVDLGSLGYELVDGSGYLGVWRSTGDHPPDVECPSPEAIRQEFFDRIATGRRSMTIWPPNPLGVSPWGE